MKVPFLDLKAQYKQIEHEVLPMVKEAMENGMFIGGPNVQGFEKEFGIELIKNGLNEYEKSLFKKKLVHFSSQEWINRIKLPKDEQRIVYSHYKAEGGLIRTSLVINLRYRRLQNIIITGDFFAYPKRAIFDLEAGLKDIPADKKLIEEKITHFFSRHNCQIPGIIPSDFINAIDKALKKVGVTEF